jgi:hypothetical protein
VLTVSHKVRSNGRAGAQEWRCAVLDGTVRGAGRGLAGMRLPSTGPAQLGHVLDFKGLVVLDCLASSESALFLMRTVRNVLPALRWLLGRQPVGHTCF